MQEAMYCLAGKLKLPGDIVCLRATHDGKLASGGDSVDYRLHLFTELICKRDQWYYNLEPEVEKKLPVPRWSRCKGSNDCGDLDPS